MTAVLRNTLSIVLGIAVGFGVNMSIILIGPTLIPPPAGVDMTTTESLSASIHLLEPQHFLAPFLAHALGSVAGALTAYLIASSYRAVFAYTIGALSLAGGIAATFMIPAPIWFIVLDLGAAYLPMAWLAIRLGRRIAGTTASAA